MTNVQPGVVNTPMAEAAADDFRRLFNIDLMAGADGMLAAQDVAQVVWETVSRPDRAYQAEGYIKDAMNCTFLPQLT